MSGDVRALGRVYFIGRYALGTELVGVADHGRVVGKLRLVVLEKLDSYVYDEAARSLRPEWRELRRFPPASEDEALSLIASMTTAQDARRRRLSWSPGDTSRFIVVADAGMVAGCVYTGVLPTLWSPDWDDASGFETEAQARRVASVVGGTVTAVGARPLSQRGAALAVQEACILADSAPESR